MKILSFKNVNGFPSVTVSATISRDIPASTTRIVKLSAAELWLENNFNDFPIAKKIMKVSLDIPLSTTLMPRLRAC